MLKRLLSLVLPLSTLLPAAEFKVEKGVFVLDGKPFQIRAGEIHYPRVPRAEWRNRIRMARAMGLNTISTYVFWNYHETRRGEFDFSGEKDVMEFVRLCGAEGMKAILRPGPFVCAEWDLGGLPAWLLAEPGIKLRTSDARYLEPAKGWMKRMGGMLQPLSVAQGGPVLMVQLENEYGYYGSDAAYLEALQKALRTGGYQGMVYTADGPAGIILRRGGLPGVLKAANFGRGAESAFEALAKTNPGQPAFCAEFWAGWFDTWGRPRYFSGSERTMADLDWMARSGASFNVYLFHGGSTRGLWTGATWMNRYTPTTCSYDFEAPLNEAGRPTGKYRAFRKVIMKYLPEETVPEVPEPPSSGSVGEIGLTEQCALLDALPEAKGGAESGGPGCRTMEDLGQITGFILYRTEVEGPVEGELALGAVKDRVHVMLDGKVIGITGRSTEGKAVPLKIPAGTHKLDLLVENMGRINYGNYMLQERKGLSAPVMLAGRELGPFEHVGLSMQEPPGGKYEEMKGASKRGKVTLYRGKVKLASPRDTWLDMRGFGRGIVWFNGRNLGRYWKEGPPQSVFLPACWMEKEKENELVILELDAETCPKKVPTSAKAIFWGHGLPPMEFDRPVSAFSRQ